MHVYILLREEIGGDKEIIDVYSSKDKARSAFAQRIKEFNPTEECLESLYAEIGLLCAEEIYEVKEYKVK